MIGIPLYCVLTVKWITIYRLYRIRIQEIRMKKQPCPRCQKIRKMVFWAILMFVFYFGVYGG